MRRVHVGSFARVVCFASLLACGAPMPRAATPAPEAPTVVPPAPPEISAAVPETASTLGALFDAWQVTGIFPADPGWAVGLVGQRGSRRWLTVRRWDDGALGEVLIEQELTSDDQVLATSLASSLVWEREAGRLLARLSDGTTTLLPYTGPAYRAPLAVRLTSSVVPVDVIAFYAQRVEILTPTELEQAQAAACRHARVPSLCGRISPQRVAEDWVEVATLAHGAPGSLRLHDRTAAPLDEQTVAIDASTAGAVVAVFEQGRTDRFRMHLHWLGVDGALTHEESLPLPARWLPGIVAQRGDGAAFVVLPELTRANRYGSLHVLGFDARGHAHLRASLPIEGTTFEGGLGALECGGALWLVTQQLVASRARVVVRASRIDARDHLAPAITVGELPLESSAATDRHFFEGEPMRFGCREGEARVAFRTPVSLDPGAGELAVLGWSAAIE